MESLRYTVTQKFLAKFMEGLTEQNTQTLDEESKML